MGEREEAAGEDAGEGAAVSESDELKKSWQECMLLGPCDATWSAKVEEAKQRAHEDNEERSWRYSFDDAVLNAEAPMKPLRRTVLLTGQVVVDAAAILSAEARIKELEARLAWLAERGVLQEATRRYASELADMVARCVKRRGKS